MVLRVIYSILIVLCAVVSLHAQHAYPVKGYKPLESPINPGDISIDWQYAPDSSLLYLYFINESDTTAYLHSYHGRIGFRIAAIINGDTIDGYLPHTYCGIGDGVSYLKSQTYASQTIDLSPYKGDMAAQLIFGVEALDSIYWSSLFPIPVDRFQFERPEEHSLKRLRRDMSRLQDKGDYAKLARIYHYQARILDALRVIDPTFYPKGSLSVSLTTEWDSIAVITFTNHADTAVAVPVYLHTSTNPDSTGMHGYFRLSDIDRGSVVPAISQPNMTWNNAMLDTELLPSGSSKAYRIPHPFLQYLRSDEAGGRIYKLYFYTSVEQVNNRKILEE